MSTDVQAQTVQDLLWEYDELQGEYDRLNAKRPANEPTAAWDEDRADLNEQARSLLDMFAQALRDHLEEATR